MRPAFTKALLCLFILQLQACAFLTGEDGIFRDRKKDYRKAESLPRIEIPEGLDDSAIVDLYPVPQAVSLSDGEVLDEFPLPMGIVDSKKAVMIQSMGDVQWILLQASPSQLWPRLKEFLSQKNMPVTIENGAAGMLESKSADGLFRYRIEQGFQRNSAELSVRFLHSPASVSSFWPEQSADKGREAAMLDELAGFFSAISDQPAYSFAAQGISTQKKIIVEPDAQGGKLLVLLASPERAFLTLEQSLKAADFSILGIDAENRSFETQYTPRLSADDKPGFFKRLFGIKPDPYDKDVKYAGNHYRFLLASDADRSHLSVRALDTASKQEADIRREQNHILLLLKERLY